MSEEKRCIGCKTVYVLTREYFYVSARTDDGFNRYCITCCKVNRSLESVGRRDKKSKLSFRQYHRAKTLGLDSDKSITLRKLFKRHFGICGICNRWVQPRYASIDHVHPVSQGGTHTWDNVQLVHLKCNLRKGDRT